MVKLILGDCLDIMKRATPNSIDAIITDPPYGLEFMGKDWDKGVPGVHFWQEMIRVLKPGGHLLAFGGTRTYHRMAVAIEDAGFEIRDMIEWVYGSGFPKSLNIGKAVDKIQGNEREFISENYRGKNAGKKSGIMGETVERIDTVTKGNSPYEGYGTALKPAHEPCVLARKPIEGTVANNVLKHGTGGLNIDGTRIGFGNESDSRVGTTDKQTGAMGKAAFGEKTGKDVSISTYKEGGRFPANLIHDNSEEVRECFPNESERFFKSIIYTAKASKSERNKGCDGLEEKDASKMSGGEETRLDRPTNHPMRTNHHPTVKPIALMEYLIKMVIPKNGTVLDPFMGSGSTGVACIKNNYNFIGIELEPEYFEIAKARIDGWRER